MSYIPRWLPCGVEVNKNWRRGMPLECCRTVCPDKPNAAIDRCYKLHFNRLKRMLMKAGIRPKEEEAWFEIKDAYFRLKKEKEANAGGEGRQSASMVSQ